MYRIIIILLLLLIYGCHSSNVKDIDKLISSGRTIDIIRCANLIGEYKKIEYIPYLFNNIEDDRVTNDLRYKGISAYQSCAEALRRLSGLEPPNKITYKLDTTIVIFYKKWAVQKKYISI